MERMEPPNTSPYQSFLMHSFTLPSITDDPSPSVSALPVSSITLFGSAQCFIDGVDGSSTYLKGWGNPVVAQAGPPEVQVNGTRDPHRAA